MKVIDNFLPCSSFEELQSMMMCAQFDWHFNNGIVTDDQPHFYQFFHMFYHYDWMQAGSSYIHLLEPVLDKLEVRKLIRIKANLTTRHLFNRETGYHVDGFIDAKGHSPFLEPHNTAIFYVNTNNGSTKFKNGATIKSVANRMGIFDHKTEHCGVTCTDEKIRIVVNLNYI